MGDSEEDYDKLLSEIDGIASSSPLRPWNSPSHQTTSGKPFSPTAEARGLELSPPPSSQALQQPSKLERKDDFAAAETLPVHKILPRWDSTSPQADIGDEIEGLLGDLGPTGHGCGGEDPGRTLHHHSTASMLGAEDEWSGVFTSVGMGVAEEKGQRPAMEDKHLMLPTFLPSTLVSRTKGARALCAVFDGHSGPQVAEFAVKRIPTLLEMEPWYCSAETAPQDVVEQSLIGVFERVDGEILAKTIGGGIVGGSTANVVLLLDNKLFIANLGDSRAVLSRGGFAEALSEDHKPDVPSEKLRIEALDGRVEWRGCWRVMGSSGSAAFRGLAVSRAFGDVDWKVPVNLVESKPEVKVLELKSEDEFVVIGCDGVWDVMSNQEAVDLARRHALPVDGQLDSGVGLSDKAAAAAARAITLAALERGTMDNVTVVVMTLRR